MPKMHGDPQRFQRELRVIVEYHNPTYVDVNALLRLIVPEGLLRQLKQTAKWPEEAPLDRDVLKDHIDHLIEAVAEVPPLKTDWGKIQACKQRVSEDPLDYLDY